VAPGSDGGVTWARGRMFITLSGSTPLKRAGGAGA
jgi:hypothetical protein